MKTLLLDADVACYQFAFKNQVDIDWDGDGDITSILWYDTVLKQVDDFIAKLLKITGCTEVVIALSDTKNNFRNDVLESYKGNRKSEKPKLWSFIREYFESKEHEYRVETRDSLEGDDILGIMATHPRYKDDCVVATIDKDLQTVPCHLYLYNKPELGITKIEPLDSIRFLFKQVLAGDAVDNYKGCPGVGIKTADKLLDPIDDVTQMWGEVIKLYEKKGLKLEDALTQVRCAYILQYQDYTKDTGVRLWTLKTALRNFNRS